MAVESLAPLIAADRIAARVRELGGCIERDLPLSADGRPLRLIGALKGALFFLTDLARALERDAAIDLVRAASYGAADESSGEVRILIPPPPDLGGEDVILVEDIVDTGRTARVLLDRIAEQQPRSLRLATLLDKPSRRAVDVAVDYCGFEIPDRFVVGYGLDYAERYRNLPGVYVLHRDEEEAADRSAASG